MKECNICKIKIQTKYNYCPLCHQTLTGESNLNEELYPLIIPIKRKTLSLTKRILLFINIVSILTLALINVLTYESQPTIWSAIPIGTIIYFWAIVRYGVLSKQNIAFKLFLLTTILITISFMIDQTFSREIYKGWALNYVSPLVLLACNLAISFIIWIKLVNYREYMIYLITMIFISIASLSLVFIHLVTVKWPSIVSSSFAFFILLFFIFFFPKLIKEEIKKRFHV